MKSRVIWLIAMVRGRTTATTRKKRIAITKGWTRGGIMLKIWVRVSISFSKKY